MFFFDDPTDVGNLISGSSAFSKSSLNIWKFSVHVLLKPGLENSEHYFASVCEMSAIVPIPSTSQTSCLRTPFSVWKQSIVPHLVLAVAS